MNRDHHFFQPELLTGVSPSLYTVVASWCGTQCSAVINVSTTLSAAFKMSARGKILFRGT